MSFVLYIVSRVFMQIVWMFYRKKMDNALKVFISHSNTDRDLVTEVIPKLQEHSIHIFGQEQFTPGQQVLPTIRRLVDETNKTLLFITKNALESPWCSFELLISLERALRINQLSVVLLLHDISESEIPQIAVLQEAAKIDFIEGSDDWVLPAVLALRETKSLSKDVMPAGNVAHGLVWSHYTGFLQYVLPILKLKLEATEWYKSQGEDVLNKLSWKLYELVPRTCTIQYNIPKKDSNVKEILSFLVCKIWRGGNPRDLYVKLYSVTNGKETYYCMCEFPNTVGTMKVMEDNHLATFSHKHPARKDEEGVTAAAFTADDKKLQLGRFYYTMNSLLSHFDNCRDTARVLLYNDERENISDVLIEAILEDLPKIKKPKEGILPSKLEKLESTDEFDYEYEVYIAHTEEDEEKASEISKYLKDNGVDSILDDEVSADNVGSTWREKLLFAAQKCRWFVILLTKSALDNKLLTFNTLSALGTSIDRRKVRVIPIVDRKKELYIPEDLRWVTYIPFDESCKRDHLKSLYNIVSGQDIPMETQLLLPAGDVAYGLAWGYVIPYLMKILPEVLDKGIVPAFKEKRCGSFRCPHKLFVVIPRSCEAGDELMDNKHGPGRISNFTETAPVYPFGPTRPFHCNIYKIASNTPDEPGLYFVGQYAAPVTCLWEMNEWQIAGVTPDSMMSEAFRFYQIVTRLMEQVSQKSEFCEFVFFDDSTESLADIMEKKIRSVDVQYTNQ